MRLVRFLILFIFFALHGIPAFGALLYVYEDLESGKTIFSQKPPVWMGVRLVHLERVDAQGKTTVEKIVGERLRVRMYRDGFLTNQESDERANAQLLFASTLPLPKPTNCPLPIINTADPVRGILEYPALQAQYLSCTVSMKDPEVALKCPVPALESTVEGAFRNPPRMLAYKECVEKESNGKIKIKTTYTPPPPASPRTVLNKCFTNGGCPMGQICVKSPAAVSGICGIPSED